MIPATVLCKIQLNLIWVLRDGLPTVVWKHIGNKHSPETLQLVSSILFQLYWHNKETSTLRLCEFTPNERSIFIELFWFKKCDYLTTLCAKQKFIRCPVAAMTTTRTQITAHNQYLACHPSALTTAAHLCLAERTSCWFVSGVFLAVTTAGKSMSRKCDVTECGSRPLVVTCGRSVLIE